jgi:hypothetical protein
VVPESREEVPAGAESGFGGFTLPEYMCAQASECPQNRPGPMSTSRQRNRTQQFDFKAIKMPKYRAGSLYKKNLRW